MGTFKSLCLSTDCSIFQATSGEIVLSLTVRRQRTDQSSWAVKIPPKLA